MSDVARRGVDVALLASEIEALRETALRYGDAVAHENGISGAGLDLEEAAILYVRKLDDEQRKANAPDYVKIVEEAEAEARRRRDSSDN